MGVADLIEEWRKVQSEWRDATDAADDLVDWARTAWKPVSEPPTEADYAEPPSPFAFQWILVIDGWGTWGPVTREQFEDVIHDPEIPEGTFYTHWARPRDVVLMPPEDK